MANHLMTRDYKVTLLNLDVVVKGPATIEDLVALIGEEAALDGIIKSEIYRSAAPRIRDNFLKKVEAHTGVKIKPAETNDKGEVTKWPKDTEMISQLERDSGTKRSAWQSLMDEASSELDMEAVLKKSLSTRKLGQEWIDQGEQVYAAIQEKRGGDPTVFLKNISEWVPGATLSPDFTAEDVGLLLKRQHAAKTKTDAVEQA